MHIFHNRPLSLACACFAVASLLCTRLTRELLPYAALLFLLLSVSFFILYLRTHVKQILSAFLCLLAVLLAISSFYVYFHFRYDFYQARKGETCTVEGTVLKRRVNQPYLTVLDAHIEKLDGEACDVDVLLQLEFSSALQMGDRFRMTGVLTDFEEDAFFDNEAYCISNGQSVRILGTSHEQYEILPERSHSLRLLFSQWNEQAVLRLHGALDREAEHLAGALLLGDRDSLPAEDTLAFRRAGVSHLLALSGLHVSILIAALEWFLRKLCCPKIIRVIGILFLSIGYLFLTGCAPSTVRAVLMLAVLSVGFCLKSDYDSLTALFSVLALILFFTPYAVYDIGMWMSFVAAGSIIVFSPACKGVMDRLLARWTLPNVFSRMLRYVCTALFVGTVANLGLMLLQGIFFGEMSLLSVPVTFLLAPILTVVLISAAVTLFIPAVGPICSFFAIAMKDVTHRFASMEGALLPLQNPLTLAWILFLSLALVFLAVAKLKSERWSLLPILLTLAVILSSYAWVLLPDRGVEVQFAGEKAGDVFLFSEKGKAVAVNFADGNASGARTLASLASLRGCTEIGDVILLHYHNTDTYFIHVLSTTVCVRTLRLPKPQNEREADIAARLEEEAAFYGVGVRYDLDDLCIPSLEILAAENAALPSGRHAALLLSVRANGKTLTYVNASVPDSALVSSAKKLLQTSAFVIFGSTGYTVSSDTKFPKLPSTVETVVLTDPKLMRLLPQLSEGTALLDDLEVRCFSLK